MYTRLLCLLAITTSAACGASHAPDPAPVEPTVGTLTAAVMAGPYADGAAFCGALARPACQPEERLFMLMDQHKQPLTLRSGAAIQLSTYASRDAISQRSHLLVSVNGALWALPELNPHDPAKGLNITGIVMRFAQEEAPDMPDDVFTLTLNYMQEVEPGGQADFQELVYMCKAGASLSCAELRTSSLLVDGMTTANLVRGATVMPMLKDKGKRIEIMDLGSFQYAEKHDKERRAALPLEGNHTLVFP